MNFALSMVKLPYEGKLIFLTSNKYNQEYPLHVTSDQMVENDEF